MNERDAVSQEPEQPAVSLSMSARAGSPTVSFTLTVIPADSIEVEDSPTLRYLPLKSGYFSLPKRVFLIVDGEKHDITSETLPEES